MFEDDAVAITTLPVRSSITGSTADLVTDLDTLMTRVTPEVVTQARDIIVEGYERLLPVPVVDAIVKAESGHYDVEDEVLEDPVETAIDGNWRPELATLVPDDLVTTVLTTAIQSVVLDASPVITRFYESGTKTWYVSTAVDAPQGEDLSRISSQIRLLDELGIFEELFDVGPASNVEEPLPGLSPEPEQKTPKVEILVVRDPDSATELTVFIDGQQATVTEVEVDPGRGWQRADWMEFRDGVAADETLSPLFSLAALAAIDEAGSSPYVED